MDEVHFTWDEKKNEQNKKKHNISFEEAKEVFGDEHAILFDDPDHSYEEERFLIMGMAGIKGVCIVSHCYRDADNTIRIISARKATKKEKKIYQKGW
ncbi:MAG: BrnT family toxin [Butyrivibrio sp.]|nr:BrnT family toxin [Muribaculum sp.]MCM1553526.1 BrnT family toxin [Butyrivibrio sp.]